MKRIKEKGGGEYDVFGTGRRLYCYLQRAGVTKAIKKQYNRRFRRTVIRALQSKESPHE